MSYSKTSLNLSLRFIVGFVVCIWIGCCVSMPTSDQNDNGEKVDEEEDLMLRFKAKGKVPVGKIAEKAIWRSVFFTIWHCIMNADSTKTPSSASVTF